MPPPSENSPGSDPSSGLEGTLSVFGFPKTTARVDAVARSPRWRGLRAAAYWGGALLVTPAVALVPPHVPWVAGVLGVGGLLGTRKWKERYTVVKFQGRCPRCQEELSLQPGTPLRSVMAIGCDECHHECRLEVSLAT
jgi:hypothetical protein